MDPLPQNKFIGTKEASEISGYNSDYIGRLCRSGKVVGRRIGRTWVVEEASLRAFVQSQELNNSERARTLSESRTKEYQAARNGSENTKQNLEKSEVSTFSPYRPLREKPTPSPLFNFRSLQEQAVAVAVALLIVNGSLLIAHSEGVAKTVRLAIEDVQAANTRVASALQSLPENPNSVFTAYKKIGSDFIVGVDTGLSAYANAVAVAGETTLALASSFENVDVNTTDAVYAFVHLPDALLVNYLIAVEETGAGALAVAESIRDIRSFETIPNADDAIEKFQLALGSSLINTSNEILVAYQTGIETWVEIAQILPSQIVAFVHTVGATTDSLVQGTPQTIAYTYDGAIYALSEPLADTTLAVVDTTANVIVAAQDALRHTGGYSFASAAEPADSAAAASLSDASSYIYNVARLSALSTYVAVKNLFTDTGNAIVSLFTPKVAVGPLPPTVAPLPVVPVPNPPTPVVSSPSYSMASGTTVQNINNQFVTVGVSKEYLEQRLRESRSSILDRRGGQNSTVSGSGTVTSVDISGGSTGLSFGGGPITSSGTFTLSGTLSISNGGTGITTAPSYGQLLMGDGVGGYSLVATSTLGLGSGGTPGGADTEVQFNNAGTFGGDSGFTFDASADRLTVVNASTTNFSSSYASSTSAFFGNLSVGALTGVLKGTAGAVSSGLVNLTTEVTGTLVVGSGGTGATSFTNNRLLTGNGTGALVDEANLTFDGSLLSVTGNASTTQLTTTGTTYLATTGGNVGIGTTSPYAKLSVVGQAVAEYFTATSTTATSTFPNISLTNLGIGGDFITDFVGTGLALSGSTLTSTLGTIIDLTSEITGTLGVANGGTGATTFGQGWLYSTGGTSALTASTSPTVNYLTATSTTATSTFAGGLAVDTNGFVYDWQTNRVGIGTAAPTVGLDIDTATDISGNLTVSGGSALTISASGPINQTGSGQVTFSGNVDATNGLDVTGANFTVGTTQFTVAPATGNTFIGGVLDLAGGLFASSTAQVTGATRLYSTLRADGAITAAGSGTGLSVTNNATVGGTFAATGNSTFGGTVGITGTLSAGATTLSGDLALGGNKITGLGNPTADQEAATKVYVDSVAQGLDLKGSVRAATTANISLSGEQTVDGVSLVSGDRILVKDQSDETTNGIYVVAGGSWSRSVDADENSEVTSGLYTFAEEGTINANSGWVLTTADPITLGSSQLDFTQFSGAGQITAGAGLTKSANTLNVIGTTDRITANADSIDIASTYAGQSSITTVGALTSGSIGSGFGNINIGASSLTAGTASFTSIVGSAITGSGNLSISGNGSFSGDLEVDGTFSAATTTLSGDLALGGKKITGLADPTSAQEAATKAYVDAIAQGLDVKASVRAATTANITLSGTQTIDGISVIAGDRVLVKDQTDAGENGIYVVAAGSWSRSSDANENSEVISGMYTFVEEGSDQANTGWSLITPNPITLDTTDLTFTQFSGSADIAAGNGLTKTGNTINAVGTLNRISVSADAIDIDSNYVGQSSLTTVGALTSGSIASGFGSINIGSSALTAGAGTLSSLTSYGSLSIGGTATTTIQGNNATSTFSGGISLASGNVNLATGGRYLINNASIIDATTLGSSVVGSSLTSVGALDSGSITTGFGDINIGANTLGAGTTTVTNLVVQNLSTSTFTGPISVPSASTTATSSLAGVNILTGGLSIGSLSGILKATAGVVNTALVSLTADISGILGVTNGGTGWGNITANTVLLGNGTNAIATTTAGTNGQVLALVSGVPTWTATTTAGTGLTYSGGALNVNTSQNIATLSNLTSNGIVQTTGGTGALSVLTIGSGVDSWITTPSSANLITAVTDETGSGALVFGTSPTISGATLSGITTIANASTSAFSANTLAVGGTATTSISSAGALTVGGNFIFGGDTFDELVGDGLDISSGDLIFDCSDVASTGLSCSGEDIVLNATGDWTGTLDSIEGASFLRSDTSDSYTSGTLTFDSGTLLDLNTTGLSIADTDITLDGASTNFNFTGNFTSNTDDLVILKSSGNVGIGTTTPPDLLTIHGGATAGSGGLTISHTQATAQLWHFRSGISGVSHTALQIGNGTPRLVIESSGNIGIGSSTPAQLLSVGGSAFIGASTAGGTSGGLGVGIVNTTAGTIRSSSSITSGAGVLIATNDAGALGASGTAFSDLFLASGSVINLNAGDVTLTHSSNTLTLGGGNLALGTNTLTAGAILANSNDVGALGASGTAWSDLFLASGSVINLNAGDVTLTHAANALTLAGATSGYIFSDGNIGVATTTPWRKLSVTDTSAQFAIGYDTANYTQFTTTSVGDLTIDPEGGNVSLFDEILYVCAGVACPAGTPTAGSIIAETAIGIGSTTPWAGLSLGTGGGTSGLAIIVAEHRPATSTSMTIDWRNGNQQTIRLGTAATAITFSGFSDGQKLVLLTCNPGGTAGAVSWSTQILWSGGTAPTQTTTANKCDVWSFLATQATSTMKIFGTQSANF
jgi:uncharacterized cupin superfamily protein